MGGRQGGSERWRMENKQIYVLKKLEEIAAVQSGLYLH